MSPSDFIKFYGTRATLPLRQPKRLPSSQAAAEGVELSRISSDSFISFREPFIRWSAEEKNAIADAVSQKIRTLKGKIEAFTAKDAQGNEARLSQLQTDCEDWERGLTILNHELK